MRKDPTEFRKRFAAWKNGKLPYKNGRASEFDDTIEFIKPYEGFSDKVYLDGNGVPTIGYGFTDSALIAKGKMSRTEADILLRKELLNREAFLTKLKNWDKLSQGSKTALRSYYYNYPAGFKDTTKFMNFWNAGDYNNAIKEVNAGMNDKKNTGLRARRLQELALLRQDPFLTKQVSPLVKLLEETPLFLPVQIQVPVDNIDFSLPNASLLSLTPRSINAWTGADSPAYGGASLRMPSLQEYMLNMLTESIMPKYKDGKLPLRYR